MFKTISLAGLLGITLLPAAAFCQTAPPPPNPGDNTGPPPMEGRRPPMERAFHVGPFGRWWNNPEFVQKLGLTADQQKKMEAVFEQNRPGLLDLLANVRKEEAAMEPLLAADPLDDAKILAQIDRVTQARAELERANGRMLLGLRKVLTLQQWKTLQAEEPHGRFPRFGGGPRNEPSRSDPGAPPQ
ncbi:MAG TPA: Spy/CpxP family protein refolding chaperone [Acidobacteriaceae bacterium]|nr:Spy/CpxP family protein refolding chaperone [Acidobacteriaceae bacterium]